MANRRSLIVPPDDLRFQLRATCSPFRLLRSADLPGDQHQ